MKRIELDENQLGPSPLEHPENSAFWDRVHEGELALQLCDVCGTVRFPIAPVCHACLSLDWHMTRIAERGTVACAVKVHVATGSREWNRAVPYLSGLVETEEGYRLPGRIICRCGQALDQGTQVEAVLVPTNSASSVYAFAHACTQNGPLP